VTRVKESSVLTTIFVIIFNIFIVEGRPGRIQVDNHRPEC